MKNKKLRELDRLLKVAKNSLEQLNIKVKGLNDVRKIQGADGTWDYDHYMLGMYNGIEICVATIEGRKPVFRSRPEIWGRDKPVSDLSISSM